MLVWVRDRGSEKNTFRSVLMKFSKKGFFALNISVEVYY